MKQNITKEQFEELSQDAKEKLYRSLFPDVMKDNNRSIAGFRTVIDINPEYITIGRMIEFLDKNEEKGFQDINFIIRPKYVKNRFEFNESEFEEYCNVLWEAVKEILEN